MRNKELLRIKQDSFDLKTNLIYNDGYIRFILCRNQAGCVKEFRRKTMNHTVLAVTLILSILIAAPAHVRAQEDPNIPDALQVLVDRGAQIRYLGTRHGMQGWVTIFKGQEQYYYVTPDGKGFLMGLLFDKDGEMATMNQVRALQDKNEGALDILTVDKPKEKDLKTTMEEKNEAFEYKTPAERMFADVQNSNWIGFGKEEAPVIYSFMDPQCPHCHTFMNDLRKGYLDKGLVQVRVIPVGFREETLSQAAFLLAAPDSKERWYKHLDGDETALPKTTTTNTQGVQKNLSLVQAWKFDVTPLTIYRGKDGKVKIVRGPAGDMNKILNDLPATNKPSS